MRVANIIALSFALAACVTTPQSSPGFNGFEGGWRGTGTFQGMPSMVDAHIAPLLDGQAWSLDVNVTATPPNGDVIRFSGRGQYAVRDGAPVAGNWIDTTGAAYAIAPRIENGVLIVDWGEGAPVRGRSEYRLQDDGDLQIDDFIPGRDGQQRRFATAELRRVL